ncbi:hypothetical protein [Pseudooceanicola sp.]
MLFIDVARRKYQRLFDLKAELSPQWCDTVVGSAADLYLARYGALISRAV